MARGLQRMRQALAEQWQAALAEERRLERVTFRPEPNPADVAAYRRAAWKRANLEQALVACRT